MSEQQETPQERLSLFQRAADKVSFGMGTPQNITVWIVLVVGWVLLFALDRSRSVQSGSFMPGWFTSTGFNFPLNLVTTVAELYIGFLVGASSNRSERNLENTLARIGDVEQQVLATEDALRAEVKANTDLTQAVHDLTEQVHALVAAPPGGAP